MQKRFSENDNELRVDQQDPRMIKRKNATFEINLHQMVYSNLQPSINSDLIVDNADVNNHTPKMFEEIKIPSSIVPLISGQALQSSPDANFQK